MRKGRILPVVIVLLGTAATTSAASTDRHWRALEPFAEAVYQDKVAEVRAALTAASDTDIAGLDAVGVDEFAKKIVYHQLYFLADCAKHSGGSLESSQACADVRSDEFAKGMKILPSVAALEPLNTSLCMEAAWLKEAQITHPPFAVLKHDGLRLLDMGQFFSCMRELKAGPTGVR